MATKTLDDEAVLWSRFKDTGDASAREKLILKYAPLVKYIAGRLAINLPPNFEVDDLISYGIFGLIEALNRYDPSRGVRFETYAAARIRGAMLDGLRAWDWVPTSLRRKAKAIESAYASLEQEFGQSVSDEQVAAAVGISVEEFQDLLVQIASTSLVSLDSIWSDLEGGENQQRLNFIANSSSADPVELVEFQEKKKLLAEAIDKLPERERLVIALYYYEGLTLKEISEVMKVTPSRISQLHAKAMLRLRASLANLKSSLA